MRTNFAYNFARLAARSERRDNSCGQDRHDDLPPPSHTGGGASWDDIERAVEENRRIFGGGGSGSGDESPPGQTKWAMAQEVARDSAGNVVRNTLGTEGYTFSVDEHDSLGYGKTTGHKDGTLHRHGYMSDAEPKDDFVKSDTPHLGLLGSIIRRLTK